MTVTPALSCDSLGTESYQRPIDLVPMEIVDPHDPQCVAEFEGEAFDFACEKTVGNVPVG